MPWRPEGPPAAARASGGQPTVVAAAHHAFVNGIDEVVWVGAVTVAVGAAFAVLVRRKDFYSRRREGYRPPAAPPLPPPPLERDLVPEAVG